ncbi:MAG: hypothetical protein LBE79_02105 [Tannerella sp.]|jgi:hypothetical protein|nr:hypothetical protein [Tannerella sp.]
MEVVRKIVSADMLTPFMDLPWASNGSQVELIVMPHKKETTQQRVVSAESLEGCLQEYANPALWGKEEYAWENNIVEKYGHI